MQINPTVLKESSYGKVMSTSNLTSKPKSH